MSYLVANPDDRFSRDLAQIIHIILSGVSVVVEFYSRFIIGRKGDIPLSHTGHYTNTLLQTPLTVLSCGLKNGL